MKVSIPIEFEVEYEGGDEDELMESQAESAAELAAIHFLSFCEISGYGTDTDAVEVFVDGFGKCAVKLAQDS